MRCRHFPAATPKFQKPFEDGVRIWGNGTFRDFRVAPHFIPRCLHFHARFAGCFSDGFWRLWMCSWGTVAIAVQSKVYVHCGPAVKNAFFTCGCGKAGPGGSAVWAQTDSQTHSPLPNWEETNCNGRKVLEAWSPHVDKRVVGGRRRRLRKFLCGLVMFLDVQVRRFVKLRPWPGWNLIGVRSVFGRCSLVAVTLALPTFYCWGYDLGLLCGIWNLPISPI